MISLTETKDIFESYNRQQIEDSSSSVLRKAAESIGVYTPMLRPDSAALYRLLIYAVKPKKLLEAGTLYGYSSILAANAMKTVHGDDFRIDTVESDPSNADSARANIANAGFAGKIRVIQGDASEVFECLEGPFDMILLDCSKTAYITLLPHVKRLLKEGGVLVADDICFHGKTALEDQSIPVPHKHRTIVNALTEFLEAVNNDEDFVSCVDTMDDGMLIAIKQNRRIL